MGTTTSQAATLAANMEAYARGRSILAAACTAALGDIGKLEQYVFTTIGFSYRGRRFEVYLECGDTLVVTHHGVADHRKISVDLSDPGCFDIIRRRADDVVAGLYD